MFRKLTRSGDTAAKDFFPGFPLAPLERRPTKKVFFSKIPHLFLFTRKPRAFQGTSDVSVTLLACFWREKRYKLNKLDKRDKLDQLDERF
jgi:hypothetical protein